MSESAAVQIVPAEMLQAFIRDIFLAVGCDSAEAGRIGQYLVAANLTGHDSHGVVRAPLYVAWMREGVVRAGQSVSVRRQGPAYAALDGNQGFGQTVVPQAVDIGIAKARTAGISAISLCRSGHAGRIGEWAERAADAGLISLHFVNVARAPLVAPFGGVDRRFSTNPVCIGVPAEADRPPFLLDFATSRVAEGKVLVASRGGKPLPEGVLIRPDGELSNDPATLYGPLMPGGPREHGRGDGALVAFGEHKGSGLAFMCDLLGGLLAGGETSGPAPQDGHLRVTNNLLSFYLDPAAFGAENLAAQARSWADYVKSSRPAAPDGEVLVPGEPEARSRQHRLAHGVPLALQVWEALRETARQVGAAVPP